MYEMKIKTVTASMTLLLLFGALVATPTSAYFMTGSGAYGGDPGRDAIMFTEDDLDYHPVIEDVANAGIEVLTVDVSYSGDAYKNFEFIADRTDGIHYDFWAISASELEEDIDDMVPPGGKVDVVFTFDLTLSMSSATPTAKQMAKDIIANLNTLDLDPMFGIGSHMDYPYYYESYGYAAQYGDNDTDGDGYGDIYGDYAWSLDLDFTDNKTVLNGTIDGLVSGWGGDGPQNYVRVLYECKESFSWRADATKIIVMFGDSPAHAAPSGLIEVEKTTDDPVEVDELGVKYTWTVNITVENIGPSTILEDVVIYDRFGGEFEVIPENVILATSEIKDKKHESHQFFLVEDPITGDRHSIKLTYTGKSRKVHMECWLDILGDRSLDPGEVATITLTVSTDENPKGHQEFTEWGTHDLNSGATVKAIVEPVEDYRVQTSWVSDPITIEAIEE
jgi:hypothetical protein